MAPCASIAYDSRVISAPLRIVLVSLVLLAAPLASAAPDTVFIEDLTWTEVRDDVAAGKTTLIVPIGGTEQNGPHMVLGKHNVRVRALADRIARSLGNALVAPVIAYVPEGSIDPPSAHMRFPGTISVPTDAFERVLEAAARSFRHAGFRDIVFIGDHGGYQAALKTTAERLNREWAKSPTRAHAILAYYRITRNRVSESARGKRTARRRDRNARGARRHVARARDRPEARARRSHAGKAVVRRRRLWRSAPLERRARSTWRRFDR